MTKEEKLHKNKRRLYLKELYLEYNSKISFLIGNLMTIKKFNEGDEQIVEENIKQMLNIFTLTNLNFRRLLKGKKMTLEEIERQIKYLETDMVMLDKLKDVKDLEDYYNVFEEVKNADHHIKAKQRIKKASKRTKNLRVLRF